MYQIIRNFIIHYKKSFNIKLFKICSKNTEYYKIYKFDIFIKYYKHYFIMIFINLIILYYYIYIVQKY